MAGGGHWAIFHLNFDLVKKFSRVLFQPKKEKTGTSGKGSQKGADWEDPRSLHIKGSIST